MPTLTVSSSSLKISPWGDVQHCREIAYGFYKVSTSSHGGYMLSKTFAQENLSIEARSYADYYNGYYCYEEDAAVSIVQWELFDKYNDVFFENTADYQRFKSIRNRKKYLYDDLVKYFPVYVKDKNITLTCTHFNEDGHSLVEGNVVTHEAISGSGIVQVVFVCHCKECGASWTCTDYHPVQTHPGVV